MKNQIQTFMILLLIVIAFFQGKVNAQSNEQIKIYGTIDSSIIKKFHVRSVQVNLYPSFIQNFEYLSVCDSTAVNQNGNFHIVLDKIPKGNLYISFKLLNNADNRSSPAEAPLRGKWITLRKTEVYPIQPGDSITLNVQSDNYIAFSATI